MQFYSSRFQYLIGSLRYYNSEGDFGVIHKFLSLVRKAQMLVSRQCILLLYNLLYSQRQTKRNMRNVTQFRSLFACQVRHLYSISLSLGEYWQDAPPLFHPLVIQIWLQSTHRWEMVHPENKKRFWISIETTVSEERRYRWKDDRLAHCSSKKPTAGEYLISDKERG